MAKKAKPASPPPGKSTAAKKTGAKPAAKSAVKSPPKAAPAAKASPSKPKPAPPQTSVPATTAPSLSERFASVDAAKEATIDALLEIIEGAEHRLCQVKRVQSFAELEPLANGQL
jgi:hypothetical protein